MRQRSLEPSWHVEPLLIARADCQPLSELRGTPLLLTKSEAAAEAGNFQNGSEHLSML